MTLANMRENGVGSGVATCDGSGSSGLRAQGKPSRHPALSLPNEQDRHHISAHSGKGCGQRHVRVNRRGETPSVQRIRWIAVLTLAAYQPVLALERDCSTADQRHERLAKLVEMTDGLRNTIERVP